VNTPLAVPNVGPMFGLLECGSAFIPAIWEISVEAMSLGSLRQAIIILYSNAL